MTGWGLLPESTWSGTAEVVAVEMPDYDAAGASNHEAECFEDIGGFLPSRGWDTVDEIKAHGKGWVSCHFKDVCFYHLKNRFQASASENEPDGRRNFLSQPRKPIVFSLEGSLSTRQEPACGQFC